MIFMYIVGLTAIMLLGSVAIAVFQQRKIKVGVIATQAVADKDFFALRIESDDFLFVKDEEAVTFVQCLDDVDDFNVLDLTASKEEATNIEVKKSKEDQLIMPKTDKKAS